MNQEQRQLAAARDLTRHWESSPMDPPSRVEWFKFFRSENTAFKSTNTRPNNGDLVSEQGRAGDQ